MKCQESSPQLITGGSGIHAGIYSIDTAFQMLDDIPRPGLLEAKAGIFCSSLIRLASVSSQDVIDPSEQIYAEQNQQLSPFTIL